MSMRRLTGMFTLLWLALALPVQALEPSEMLKDPALEARARALSAVKNFTAWAADRTGTDATTVLSARGPKHQRKLPRPLSENCSDASPRRRARGASRGQLLSALSVLLAAVGCAPPGPKAPESATTAMRHTVGRP